MAKYSYEALNGSGKIVKGSLDAADDRSAIDAVKGLGFTPVSVKAGGVNISKSGGGKDLFSKKPSARDLSVFCRQFVSMIRAGVTILDCLRMLGDSTENKRLKAAVNDVRVGTETGATLSQAMGAHPNEFPDLLVKMTAAGEASGSLDIALERMAKQFETSARTKALVKKAMIYPIVVLIVALGVIVVMLEFVIPQYTEMFSELDTELPGITKAVVSLSDGLRDYWFVVLPIIIGLIVALKAFSKSDAGKHFFGKLALRIPAVSNLVTKSASALMSRTLSTLIGAGLPMVEAVQIVSETMTNIYFKEALEHAVEEITIGQPLSKPLEDSGLFPPMAFYMVRIGEETGNIEEMLDKLAEYYEEEVENAVASLMAAMEPMIIVVLALVVGTLVGACLAPMMSMYQALDSL